VRRKGSSYDRYERVSENLTFVWNIEIIKVVPEWQLRIFQTQQQIHRLPTPNYEPNVIVREDSITYFVGRNGEVMITHNYLVGTDIFDCSPKRVSAKPPWKCWSIFQSAHGFGTGVTWGGMH